MGKLSIPDESKSSKLAWLKTVHSCSEILLGIAGSAGLLDQQKCKPKKRMGNYNNSPFPKCQQNYLRWETSVGMHELVIMPASRNSFLAQGFQGAFEADILMLQYFNASHKSCIYCNLKIPSVFVTIRG